MTSDERNELLQDANQLVYTAIKFSGLYKELTSAEWDGLAEKMGKKAVAYIEEWIDVELTAIEAAKESTNAH